MGTKKRICDNCKEVGNPGGWGDARKVLVTNPVTRKRERLRLCRECRKLYREQDMIVRSRR